MQGLPTTGPTCKEDLSDWIVAGRLDFRRRLPHRASAYKRTDDAKAHRGYVVDAGVRYVAGANQFSVTGSYGEMDDTAAAHTSLMGSYARTLGPGVKLHLNLAYVDSTSAKTSSDYDRTATRNMRPTDARGQYGNDPGREVGRTAITGIKVAF